MAILKNGDPGPRGRPLIVISGTLVLFGVADQGGTLQGLATIPEGLWELSLGIYCTFWGFRPSSPILRDTQGTHVKATLATSPG